MPRFDVFSAVRCALGEGPVWDPSRKTLFWVDIHRGTVHSRVYPDGSGKSWQVGGNPSAAIVSASNELIVPSGRLVLRFDPNHGGFRPVLELSSEPDQNRANDAKCGPDGRLWLGTMDRTETASTGRLWRFDADGNGTVVRSGIGIPNTLAWDTDRRRFYFADSLLGDMYVFDYSPESAAISNERVFFAKELADGVPDGSAIDEEGCLWNARWDGGCVIRISPDGDLEERIELPLQRPTSCAFGGQDMRTLFVTSASVDDTEAERLDGMVLMIRVDVRGVPVPPCRLNLDRPAASSASASGSSNHV